MPMVAGSEHYFEPDRIWSGSQVCADCGATLGYTRRAETPEEEAMAARDRVRKGPSKMDRKLNGMPEAPKARRRAGATQPHLPGTDGGIKPLDDVAHSYAKIRDERIALNAEEHTLKDLARSLMKKFEKTIYRKAGVEILLITREEDVKVKVKKADDDGDDEDGATSSRFEVNA